MVEFTQEALDAALKHKNMTVTKDAVGDELSERRRIVTVEKRNGLIVHPTMFTIDWYVNGCTLYFAGGLIVPFRYVRQSGTWPNAAKLNLQFYDENDNVVAVLPIENFEKASA